MGRQVNFYLAREDEIQFLDFVRGTGDVKVLPYKSQTRDFAPVQELADPLSSDFGFILFLFNHEISSNLVMRFVERQGYYVIDSSQSSVIEFTRSVVRENRISRGRIWAEFTSLDREKMALVPKEPAFKEWYETISKWVRKHFVKLEPLIYASPGALKFREAGGSFRE